MKKKILIISLNSAYPLSHGGAVAQYFFLERLIEDFEVDFITLCNSENEIQNLKNLQKEIKGLNIFFYNNTPIKKKQINKILDFIVYKLFKIYSLFKGKFITTYEGVDFFKFGNKNFVSFLSSHLKTNYYDICQLDFFETLNLIPVLPKSLKKVFIHHEIRFKKYSHEKDLKNDYNNYIIEITKTLEISFLNETNKVVVFNDDDLKQLEEIKHKVEISPFGIPKKLIIKNDFNKEYNFFFFLGSENHTPNRDGLFWFLDTIYIPNYHLINKPIKILGNWSLDTINKYSINNFIEFTGFLESLLEIYEEGIMIAPIVSGSGIRTKILEAFANKVPVVCTSFAAEGLINEENNCHLFIFHDTLSFLELYNSNLINNTVINNIVQKGFDYYNENFNSDKLYNKRLNIYNNL